MIFEVKSKEEKSVDKIYNKIMKEYELFFDFNWKTQKPKIFKLSPKIYSELTEGLLRKSATAHAKGEYLFLQNKYFKNDKEIERILRHEIAHAFTYCVAKFRRAKPHWLWEGIAVYLSKENKNKERSKFHKFLKNYDSMDRDAYYECGFAVQFLIENYGKQKLLKLIKSLKDIDSKNKFAKKFKEIYGFELKYKNFEDKV